LRPSALEQTRLLEPEAFIFGQRDGFTYIHPMMNRHRYFIVALILSGTGACASAQRVPDIPTVGSASAETSAGVVPCVATGTCRIMPTLNVPTCGDMKIVETTTIKDLKAPSDDVECIQRSYWLIRNSDAPPILLAVDCTEQIGAATTGTSTIKIEKCDLQFLYMEYWYDDHCIVREVGINLTTLKPFQETEADGVVRKNECDDRSSTPRAIQLPHGRGVEGSPLIDLTGDQVHLE
jgi:hypothetical protein